ncbi:MAG: ABC-2 transporter permease [Candidatus Izemoplasmatales bacterium]
MLNLVRKELKLSINKFFFILPFILGLLFFIPGWIYLLVFMYFFWISVPQIYSAYLNQKDYDFVSILPVSKKAVVTSKIIAILLIEGLHVLFAVIFGVIHNLIYGSWNLFMDINYAFFGVGILMFGVFNIVFLPAYFKTAYFFGKPLIKGTIATVIYGFIFEFGAIYSLSHPDSFGWVHTLLEGPVSTQIIVLIISVTASAILSFIALKKSIHHYESII